MGLGLYLRARAGVDDALGVIERHVRERCADVLERASVGEGALSVCLHPAAEDVEFALDGVDVTVSAKTSGAGPGYHACVCDLVHGLGRALRTSWEPAPDGDEPGEGDETGYFVTADSSALEAEMLAWLRGLAGVVADQAAEGASGFLISLGTGTRFEFDGLMATPLGPRSIEWVEATRRDPRAGIDIFPWWPRGLGAEHSAGRALTRMWTDVRWRPPVDDAEVALLARVDADLRRAHELAPTAALPWAEWAEIAGWLGREDALTRHIIERARGLTPEIGYRRRPVREWLTGRWSILIPGGMASSFDEQGTWCAFMPGRTLWMTSFTIGDPDQPTRTAAETLPSGACSGTLLELPVPDGCAQRASLAKTEEGETTLTLELARPHRLAVFTFVLEDPADLEWAKATASSIEG